MSKKNMSIANFNIVFGDKEEPLLNYFDSIIFPALKSDETAPKPEGTCRLLNIQVLEVSAGLFALAGIIVKKTTLEVKSKFDSNQNLIETDEKYSTAPYSSFIIYLNNHRMVFVKNQKGSPDLRAFASTVKNILKKYIRAENHKRKKDNLPIFPLPIINIVGIPIKDSIQEILRKADKINELKLKFYPLNGDLDFSGLFEGIQLI